MKTRYKILIIISGSIAAIKVPFLIKLLKDNEIDVQCALTKNARTMVTKEVIEAISENPVLDSLSYMKHIAISRNTDLITIIPATANIIAKIAHGIADDIATTIILASNKQTLIVPAMNKEMWDNTATQDNTFILKKRGFMIMEPVIGNLACGEYGIGRMPEIEDISNFILKTLNNKDKPLKDYKVIVTAGPTREYIDDVRYISNNSSGLQGYLIANALHERGAEIILISGITNLCPPKEINCINIVSADQMLKATLENLPADIFISAAAVCDFKPTDFHKGKIKKENLNKNTNTMIKLSPTKDILRIISDSTQWETTSQTIEKFVRPRLTIGFAMEAENILENAQQKLISKKCDWIFANSITSANNTNTNLFFITKSTIINLGHTSKKQASEKIAEYITDFFIKTKRY